MTRLSMSIGKLNKQMDQSRVNKDHQLKNELIASKVDAMKRLSDLKGDTSNLKRKELSVLLYCCYGELTNYKTVARLLLISKLNAKRLVNPAPCELPAAAAIPVSTQL